MTINCTFLTLAGETMNAKSKELAANSVCPPIAKAIIAANYTETYSNKIAA